MKEAEEVRKSSSSTKTPADRVGNQQVELSGGKSLTSLEEQMNRLLKRLGVPLRAVWLPSRGSKEHAKIIPEEKWVMIYDEEEDEAWTSLIHELVEWRLRPVLKVYRDTINQLITLIDNIAYSRKEEALSNIVNDFMAWRSLKAESQGSTNQSA